MTKTEPMTWTTTDRSEFTAPTDDLDDIKPTGLGRPFYALVIDTDGFVLTPEDLDDWLTDPDDLDSNLTPDRVVLVHERYAVGLRYGGTRLRAPGCYRSHDVWAEQDLYGYDPDEVRTVWQQYERMSDALMATTERTASATDLMDGRNPKDQP